MPDKKVKAKPEKPTLGFYVFCDGAASGNPGPGGYGAIIAWLKDGDASPVIEFGAGKGHTTNNEMELAGVLRALEKIPVNQDPIYVHTDSTYVIKGITKWVFGWMKRGWKTAEGKDVSHPQIWQALHAQVKRLGPKRIQWRYVRGHVGVPGNERVDEIAVSFSKHQYVHLYHGDFLKYPVAILDLPDSFEVPERSNEKKEKKAALCYLSLVNDQLERHADWKSCEARVKGRPGAKFKKIESEGEMSEILKKWGVKAQ